jgi:curved DNA-binding protein CbpA
MSYKDKVKKYLSLLEVTPDYTLKELKKAYKLQLLVWHPDRWNKNENQKKVATNRTADINVGYNFLKDNWSEINQQHSEDYEQKKEPKKTQKKQKPNSNVNSKTKTQNSNNQPPPILGAIYLFIILFIIAVIIRSIDDKEKIVVNSVKNVYQASEDSIKAEQKSSIALSKRIANEKAKEDSISRIQFENQITKKNNELKRLAMNQAIKDFRHFFIENKDGEEYFDKNEMFKFLECDSSEKWTNEYKNRLKNYNYRFSSSYNKYSDQRSINEIIIPIEHRLNYIKKLPIISVNHMKFYRNHFNVNISIIFNSSGEDQKIGSVSYADYQNQDKIKSFPLFIDQSLDVFKTACQKCKGINTGYFDRSSEISDYLLTADMKLMSDDLCEFDIELNLPYTLGIKSITFYDVGFIGNNYTYSILKQFRMAYQRWNETIPYRDKRFKNYTPIIFNKFNDMGLDTLLKRQNNQ